jgi:hypothetical protein
LACVAPFGLRIQHVDLLFGQSGPAPRLEAAGHRSHAAIAHRLQGTRRQQ